MELKYRKELDGFRAIAALMVMFFHFFQISYFNDLYPTISKIAIFGQTGVSMFFVLSGFLITRILLYTKNAPGFFFNFYIRRALRIFPLYYLFLAVYYFLLPLIFKTPVATFKEQSYYWVYLQNFAMTFNWKHAGPEHFWSLAVEEHFYLFWPCVVFFFNNRKIVTLSLSIVILALICRFLLVSSKHEVFYFTFCRIDELAIGAILAILEIRNKLIAKNSSKFLLLFIITAIPTLIMWTIFTGSHNATMQVFKFVLISVSYFSILGFIISLRDTHLIKKLLRSRPLRFSGKISYGLYVYHPICFIILFTFYKTSNTVIDLILMFAFTYLVATLSYYCFEAHFLKLKRLFEYKKAEVAKLQKVYKSTAIISAETLSKQKD